ncbi:CesT family type III secretion system chaperone [Algicola sagamiensis]|uniref:CesT family type III secretion system chaperone n=1 Tax=Algicola sagamiensis TaxID=163869 RepID=UPI00035F48C7|nr:CesT family type III secretion system chaperone [Algicola sagamiensis]
MANQLTLLMRDFSQEYDTELSNDDGRWIIQVDDTEVSVFQHGNLLYFSVDVILLPEDENDRGETLKLCARQVLAATEYFPVCLYLDKETPYLHAASSLEIGQMQLDDFCENLNRFVNVVEQFKSVESFQPQAVVPAMMIRP